MEHTFKNDKVNRQYILSYDGGEAFINYMVADGKVIMTHTEVPAKDEGKGIGSELVRDALEDVKANNLKVVPLCPFVSAYIKRHPQWESILFNGYEVE